MMAVDDNAVDGRAVDGGAADGSAVEGNLVEVSVSELAGAIKRTVESAFGLVRLRGEISGYRGPHSSGHCYFALKDESARIDAVIWRGTFQKLKVRPEDGMEVIATGRVTTYPGRSAYQIVIERIEPAGIGALMALVEERRRKLAAEGLFDEARKKPLPYLPRVIGVITSPTGAVIRDILHRLADRFPVHVLVWPVRVQGETSAGEVTAAINGFNAIEPGGLVPRPDLLIVARGGGSLEDLWGFNDEAVVRAAAASAIPLISAVGHETDWTLIDHAADRRAPTPTAAAEFAVPVRAELVTSLAETGVRGARALRRLVEERRLRLGAASRALPRREALLDTARQRVDRASEALGRWRDNAIRSRRDRIAALAPRITLRPLRQRINVEGVRIKGLGQRAEQALRRTASERRRHLERTAPRLRVAMTARLRDRASRFAGLAKLADSLGYKRVLARGYAVVLDNAGTIVSAVAGAQAARSVTIEFADGRVGASIEPDGAPKPVGAGGKPRGDGGGGGGRSGGPGGGQGSLF